MAIGTIQPVHNFVDKRRGRVQTGSEMNANGYNILTVAEARTRLQSLNAAYYTNARLDAMTFNDMIYAARDAASI